MKAQQVSDNVLKTLTDGLERLETENKKLKEKLYEYQEQCRWLEYQLELARQDCVCHRKKGDSNARDNTCCTSR